VAAGVEPGPAAIEGEAVGADPREAAVGVRVTSIGCHLPDESR